MKTIVPVRGRAKVIRKKAARMLPDTGLCVDTGEPVDGRLSGRYMAF